MAQLALPLPTLWERFVRWISRAGQVAAVGSVAIGGAYVGGAYLTDSFPFNNGGAAPAGTANIWVDTNGGTCTDGALRAYVDAEACGSFDAASDTAENGDVILVRSGSYGNQTITGSNSRTAMATLSAEDEETDDAVTFDILTTNGDWLTIKHMDSHVGETSHLGTGGCAWCNKEGGSNLTLDDVNLWGKWAAGEISGGSVHSIADNVTHQNSNLGTPGNTSDRLCGSDDEPFRVSEGTDIAFINNRYHPFFGEAGCYHLETFRLWDTIDGILFRNNIFAEGGGDSTGYISSSPGGCTPPTCPENKNIHVIQNVFGDKCCGLAGYDFSTGGACEMNVVAYNYFKDGGAGFQNNCDAGTGPHIYVGNMGYNDGGCVVSASEGTGAPNLWIASSHGTCTGNTWLSGTNNDWSSYLLADDYHLTGSSPSIDAGENTICQLWTGGFDIDGEPRDDGTCDAGPDEYHP